MEKEHSNYSFHCCYDAVDGKPYHLYLHLGLRVDSLEKMKSLSFDVNAYGFYIDFHDSWDDMMNMCEAIEELGGEGATMSDVWDSFPVMRMPMGFTLLMNKNGGRIPDMFCAEGSRGVALVSDETETAVEYVKDLCLFYNTPSMAGMAKQMGIPYKREYEEGFL